MKVKIYQPSKTVTQSGKKDKPWMLVPIIEDNHLSIDDLTGWTSSNNTLSQLKLKFQTPEEAEIYVQSQGWDYQIVQPKISLVIKKSYADNFS
jgi:hypothetical protein